MIATVPARLDMPHLFVVDHIPRLCFGHHREAIKEYQYAQKANHRYNQEPRISDLKESQSLSLLGLN